MKKLLKKLTIQSLLLIIYIICFPNYVNSNEIKFPKENILSKIGNTYQLEEPGVEDFYTCFSPNDTLDIGRIYVRYLQFSSLKLDLEEENSLFNRENKNLELEIKSVEKQLQTSKEITAIINNDRQTGYDLYYEEATLHISSNKRNKVKLILISTSTGVVGIAVGILIGIFIK